MEGEEGPQADAGFVLDVTSGLYYHATSGFYYDAKGGWYYSTRDGLYYTFEDGTYAPLTSASSHSNPLEEQVVGEGYLPDRKEGHSTTTCGPGSDDLGHSVGTQETSEGYFAKLEDQMADAAAQPSCRCERSSEALDVAQTNTHETNISHPQETATMNTRHFESGEDSWSQDTLSWVDIPTDQTEGNAKEQAVCHSEEGDPRPASAWIEEALIELYLQNYPSLSADVKEEGPMITSADIFVDTPPETPRNQWASSNEQLIEEAYAQGGSDNLATDRLQHTGFFARSLSQDKMAMDEVYIEHATNANGHEESDDESEELEEGEWRPEEGDREKYMFYDLEEEAEEGEICTSQDCSLWDQQGICDNKDVSTSYPAHQLGIPRLDGEVCSSMQGQTDGELSKGDQEYTRLDNSKGTTASDNPDLAAVAEDPRDLAEADQAEEQWRAQYGQVTRPGGKARSLPGAMDLWDWTIVEQDRKVSKKKKKMKKHSIRLVGRLAPNSQRVHPSLGSSGGLIRTSPICEVDHEFVKVSSGRIYKLRRPSSKHVAAVVNYDSSNPTHDWGFPPLKVLLTEDAEGETGYTPETTKLSADMVVSKPFVPNYGHWRFQPLVSTKKIRGPSVSASFLSFTQDEAAEMEQRKHRYRDRAAERRTLHRGFGTGPGQKGMPEHEIERLEAEAATEMPAALAKAALAPRLGKDNVGKRMLEGMGWKEGQTLGPGEGGLINPIQALGNSGRAGLGWG